MKGSKRSGRPRSLWAKAPPQRGAPRRRVPPVPVIILTGFLGSGKTTLLRSLLVQAHKRGLDLGVVVNDMSEVDVDGIIVARTDFFEGNEAGLRSIHDCVLSSSEGVTKLDGALDAILANSRPALIVVETSGSCHPMPLIRLLRRRTQLRLTGVLVLVDGAMIVEDYECGRRLRPAMEGNVTSGVRDTTNLLVEQVMFGSHVFITKTDRIAEQHVRPVAEALHALNPRVSVGSLPFGNLALDDALGLPEYDFKRVEELALELSPVLAAEEAAGHPYDIATRVLEDDRPFHPQRLWDTCNHHLGQHIYRSKGFFYLASRDDTSLLWNQAAGGVALELVGYWRAGILEHEDHGLGEDEIEGLRRMLREEPGRFGDRRCSVTVIGDRTQVETFTEALRACFLTDDEIAHWQSGGTFEDPWPESYETREL